MNTSEPITPQIANDESTSASAEADPESKIEPLPANGRHPVRRPDFESIKIVLLALLDRIDALETEVREGPLSQMDLRDEVSQFESALIRAALASTKGRQRRAARALGMKVSTLNAKIQRYHVGTSTNDSDSTR